MKQVTKETFFASFATLRGVSTGCSGSDWKVWEVRLNGYVIARSIEDETGEEKFYIKNT